MAKGYIHSIESMGLVDGPGIRSVIFMQGCALRCRYCHNPDTWKIKEENSLILTAEEVVDRLIRFKPYYGKDGGVTFSGGEPLLQNEFLLETMKLCRKHNINICLDTAGYTPYPYEEILEYTDLVIFDVKHYTPEGYKDITGQSIDESLAFLESVQRMGKRLWIRHVVVPSLTDSEEHLNALSSYLKTIKNVERIELLAYHTLGVEKYHHLGIPYTLEKTKAMDKSVVSKWNKKINKEVIDDKPRSGSLERL